MANQQEGFTRRVAERVRGSAHNVWLAGLGFWATAEKNGAEILDQLIKDGEEIENRQREQQADSEALKSSREKAQESIHASLSKIEEVFDKRMSNTLNRLQIPSRRDIEDLKEQVDEMSENLQAYLSSQKKNK